MATAKRSTYAPNQCSGMKNNEIQNDSKELWKRVAIALLSVVAGFLLQAVTIEKPKTDSSVLVQLMRMEEKILDKLEIAVEGIYELLRDRR